MMTLHFKSDERFLLKNTNSSTKISNYKPNVLFALVMTAATLVFSSQAYAVTRTCPVKGEVANGGGHLFVQGIPGSGNTVLGARKDSRAKTLSVLESRHGIQNYFAKYIKKGTKVSVTAYTYNDNGLGCDTSNRYTATVVGTK
jgi:hypothetical protein